MRLLKLILFFAQSILYLFCCIEPVQNLQQLFPDMPVSEVENALEAVDGDINEAAGVILNQSLTGL